jgi:hypothetical protein
VPGAMSGRRCARLSTSVPPTQLGVAAARRARPPPRLLDTPTSSRDWLEIFRHNGSVPEMDAKGNERTASPAAEQGAAFEWLSGVSEARLRSEGADVSKYAVEHIAEAMGRNGPASLRAEAEVLLLAGTDAGLSHCPRSRRRILWRRHQLSDDARAQTRRVRPSGV